MEAIRLIQRCAQFIATHTEMFSVRDSAPDTAGHIPDVDRIWIKGWFPSCSSCPVSSADAN